MRALTTTARLASSGANRGGVAGAAPPRYGHVANPLGLASVRASSSPLPRRAAALDLRAVEATVESVVDVEYAPAPAPTPAAAVVASVPSGRAGVNGLALAALAAFAALSLPEAAHASAASTDALAAFDIPGLVGDDPVREARAGPTAGDVDDPLPAGASPPPPPAPPRPPPCPPAPPPPPPRFAWLSEPLHGARSITTLIFDLFVHCFAPANVSSSGATPPLTPISQP